VTVTIIPPKLKNRKTRCALYIIDKEVNERKLRLNLKVYCGLLKGERSEYQAVKLSELGVLLYALYIRKLCGKKRKR
jgi:16S rRNA U1498 N3-methylase RsmE